MACGPTQRAFDHSDSLFEAKRRYIEYATAEGTQNAIYVKSTGRN